MSPQVNNSAENNLYFIPHPYESKNISVDQNKHSKVEPTHFYDLKNHENPNSVIKKIFTKYDALIYPKGIINRNISKISHLFQIVIYKVKSSFIFDKIKVCFDLFTLTIQAFYSLDERHSSILLLSRHYEIIKKENHLRRSLLELIQNIFETEGEVVSLTPDIKRKQKLLSAEWTQIQQSKEDIYKQYQKDLLKYLKYLFLNFGFLFSFLPFKKLLDLVFFLRKFPVFVEIIDFTLAYLHLNQRIEKSKILIRYEKFLNTQISPLLKPKAFEVHTKNDLINSSTPFFSKANFKNMGDWEEIKQYFEVNRKIIKKQLSVNDKSPFFSIRLQGIKYKKIVKLVTNRSFNTIMLEYEKKYEALHFPKSLSKFALLNHYVNHQLVVETQAFDYLKQLVRNKIKVEKLFLNILKKQAVMALTYQAIILAIGLAAYSYGILFVPLIYITEITLTLYLMSLLGYLVSLVVNYRMKGRYRKHTSFFLNFKIKIFHLRYEIKSYFFNRKFKEILTKERTTLSASNSHHIQDAQIKVQSLRHTLNLLKKQKQEQEWNDFVDYSQISPESLSLFKETLREINFDLIGKNKKKLLKNLLKADLSLLRKNLHSLQEAPQRDKHLDSFMDEIKTLLNLTEDAYLAFIKLGSKP